MKFAYKYKKLTAMLLSIILFVNMLSFYALAEDSTLSEVAMDDTLRTSGDVDNVYNKIHFYFDCEEHTMIDDMSELKEATNSLSGTGSESSTYALANSDPGEIQITVQFASDFMETDEYKAFSQERSELNSIEEVREFRSRLNAVSKQYHEQIVSSNIDSLSRLEYKEISIGEYSPFAVLTVDAATVDAETIVTLAESASIANISVSQEVEVAQAVSWNNTLKEINAYDIISDETYTGSGIRIGIYEAFGFCDITQDNLLDKDITLRGSSLVVGEHATMVASVLTTIAPEAEYYAAYVLEDDIGIEWFIEKGCDIVNCSFNYTSNTKNADGTYTVGVRGYRYDVDAIYDYQIRANFVTVVASAGNYSNDNTSEKYNPNREVVSPGYAYNVITVGGVKRTWNLFQYYLEYDNNACYVCSTPTVKPNVSAIMTVDVPSMGSCTGTSVAAPQVAGCIALLKESNVSYCTYPERVLSVITSTAQKTNDYTEDIGYFDSRVGAGVIDLQAMLDNKTYRITHNESGAANRELLSIELNLTSGTEFQAALGWFANAVNTSESGVSVSQVSITNYNLKIYDPSGDLISSELPRTSVELVRFTAGETGTYRIVLYQASTKYVDSGEDWVALTYNF